MLLARDATTVTFVAVPALGRQGDPPKLVVLPPVSPPSWILSVWLDLMVTIFCAIS